MPDSLPLLPHQEQAVAAILAELKKGAPKVLLSLPPRTGGTRAMVEAVSTLLRSDAHSRILLVVPRRTLAHQVHQALIERCPETAPAFLRDSKAPDANARCSVVTQGAARFWTRGQPEWPSFFDLVVVPDANYGLSWVMDTFRCPVVALFLGPEEYADRLYDASLCFEWSWSDAVRAGVVVPWYGIQVCIEEEQLLPMPDGMSALTMTRRMICPADMAAIARELSHPEGDPLPGKTVAFAATHRMAKAFSNAFNEYYHREDVSVAPELEWTARTPSVRQFQTSDLPRIVVAVDRSEGLDLPAVTNVVLLRQINSTSILLRLASVGARPSPGKKAFRLIDAFNNFFWLDGLQRQD